MTAGVKRRRRSGRRRRGRRGRERGSAGEGSPGAALRRAGFRTLGRGLGILGAGVVLGTAGAGIAPTRASAETEPPAACVARARVEPERVYPGEPVVYSVEILRRTDVDRVEWLDAPRFPGFRAEWLPGRTGPEPVERAGARYTVATERRVLFAPRAGLHRIPSASLTCHLPGQRQAVARAGGGEVRVEPVPEAGRPPGAPPLVGPVRVVSRIQPERVVLGQTARLWILVRGPGNVWEAEPPFGESLPGADLFPEPPTLDLDAGNGVRLTRTFRYRIVPRTAGVVRIPSVEVSWFDPEKRRWTASRSPARELLVEPAAARPAEPAEAPPSAEVSGATRTEPGPPREGAPRPGAAGRVLLAAGVALALAAATLLTVRQRRGRPGSRALAAALARLRTAREPAALAEAQRDALRAALELARPGARALTAEELRREAPPDSPLADAASLLEHLERTRFAGTPPDPLDPTRLTATLRPLLPRKGGRS